MTTLTSWVRALRTRLSRAAARWLRCSASRHEPAALSPLQGAAQSQPEPVRAVHWHAGARGAAALTLASAAHHGPLGRVYPHCKAGLMQVANFGPSTATNPVGTLLAGGDSRVVCSADLSLACSTDRSSRCVASRIPLRCLGCDTPAHDHHRRAAAQALQFGAFAQ